MTHLYSDKTSAVRLNSFGTNLEICFMMLEVVVAPVFQREPLLAADRSAKKSSLATGKVTLCRCTNCLQAGTLHVVCVCCLCMCVYARQLRFAPSPWNALDYRAGLIASLVMQV